MTIEELKAKAAENNFDAIKELATRMWTGDDVKKDRPSTFPLWIKAYELNSQDNLVTRRIGSCFYYGYGVNEDDDTAFKYFMESALRADAISQYFVALILERKNDVSCIEWYDKATRNGDMDSAVNLGKIYLEGKLISQDIFKADEYFSVVKDSKDDSCMMDIMRIYYFGPNSNGMQDMNKSIYWCKSAAECGNIEAVRNLAVLYAECNLDDKEYYEFLKTLVSNGEALLRLYKYYRDSNNNDEALFYLNAAVNLAYPESYYEIGLVYFNGLCGQAINKEKAIACWRNGCDKKDTSSMVMIGYGHLNGECVDQNISLAIQLFEEASELGSLTAARELGVMYFRGDKVESDYEKAYNYLSSISEDDEDSLAYLGLMHIYGRYFEKDNTQGIKLILESINKDSTVGKGLLKEAFYNNALTPEEDIKVCEFFIQTDNDAESMWHLYVSYKNGNGVEKDFDKAMKWLEKAVEYQDSRALLEMMRYYYFGDIIKSDLNKAEELCKLAVLKGNRTAVNNLLTIEKELLGESQGYNAYISFILEEGIKCNDEALIAAYRYYSDLKDEKYYDTAFNYLERAYVNKNPSSFFKMGCVFYDGQLGKATDKSKAYEYWLIGTHNNDPYSMDMVGNAYIKGEILQQNVELGIELLEKAVSAGNEVAALDLAKYYLFGLYFEQDIDKSVHYYKKAADMGNAEAQNEIATYYLQGSNGLSKDENKAFELLEKAATNNNASAQHNISLCYYNGWGTAIDIEKSIFWCEKAASNGNQDAIKNLDILKAINTESKNFDVQNGVLISYNGCADNINIPEGVTRIANGAFYAARNNYKNIGIAGIILPSSLRHIDENAFSNLLVPWVAFGISEYNEHFSVQDGVLFNKDKTLLIKYPIDKQDFEYAVPDTVKQISPNAFKYARNLRKLVLPSSLENIGEEAITALNNLQYIDFSKTKLVEFPKSLCASCNKLIDVKFPTNLRKIGWGAFFGDNSLRQISLPNELTEIAECAFGNCSNLSDINISKSVVKIGESAFTECTSLHSIIIPRDINVHPEAIPQNCKVKYYRAKGDLNYSQSENIARKGTVESQSDTKDGNDKSGGCYVATCVYGSYDCPPVWTLRRFRDNTLSQNLFGRMFIRVYYAVSPTIVKMFGKYKWFHNMWKKPLDRLVSKLQRNGMESTPYQD